MYTLDPCAALAIRGDQPGERLGFPVVDVGDLDGDGAADLLVGAPYYRSAVVGGPAANLAGRAMLFYGRRDKPFASQPDAILVGVEANAFAGSGAVGGDLDGDGCRDLAVAAPYSGGSRGRIFIVYGEAEQGGAGGGGCRRLAGTVTLEPGAGAQHGGWDVAAIDGESPGDTLGFSVEAADLDGDDADDLWIGAPYKSLDGVDSVGVAYLFYGGPERLTGTSALGADGRPADAWLTGTWEYDALGGDLAVSRPSAAGDGALIGVAVFHRTHSALFEGSILVLPADANPATPEADRYQGRILDDDLALEIAGSAEFGRLGVRVVSGRDVDGDGDDDFVFSAPDADSAAERSGLIYLFTGAHLRAELALGVPGQISADAADARWSGSYRQEQLGLGLTLIDDVTGDRIADIAMGIGADSPEEVYEAGGAFVIPGRSWQPGGGDPVVVEPSSSAVFATWQAAAYDQNTARGMTGIAGWPGLIFGAARWGDEECSECGAAFAVSPVLEGSGAEASR